MDKRYMVTNHEYFNSGGGCMISIFNVYDAQQNSTKYVIANEEGFSWQTADTVSGDNDWFFADSELMNKVVIGTWNWDALTSEPSFDQHQFTEEEWQLFKYCQFEWYKRDCKQCGYRATVTLSDLTVELYESLTEHQRTWLRDNDESLYTDGYKVYMPESYVDEITEENNKRLQRVKDFKRWYERQLYDGEILENSFMTVVIGDKSVAIPIHADTYQLMETFLDEVIEQW